MCYQREKGTGCYVCKTCDVYFHKECVEAPFEIKVHPAYPFLSLQLCTPPGFLPRYILPTAYNTRYLSCLICDGSMLHMAYHCPIYDVIMHPVCALKPIPTVINLFKRHSHPLIFFPKQSFLACDICGMVKPFIPTYVCARCVFFAHQDCIYFPYVIKISRHQHRISFTYSLPPGNYFCGVCRQKVDNHCGAYSCNKCDAYFVHSRCALRRDLWDGEELEGVPEEFEEVVEPFQVVADGIILHISHDHHLKLEVSDVYDDNSFCQACILPIYEGNYYSCVDGHCDFTLHETCANAPLKQYSPLYARSLDLKVVSDNGYFRCDACRRRSCGFVYENPPGGRSFTLDLRCASISEPFEYEGHEHPLYLALSPKEEESATCQICQGANRDCRKLNCIECNYILCFRCATLPYKARYKHDKHFLTFQKETNVESDQSGWCEACEGKIGSSKEGGFYACDDYCCTTLHVNCLLGTEPYMKRGEIMFMGEHNVRILLNNTMSRPICDMFHYYGDEGERCPYKVLFQKKQLKYCSFSCLLASC